MLGMMGEDLVAQPFEAKAMAPRGYRMPADVRKRVMASIRKRDTQPELMLRRAMWRRGIRGWRCHVRMPGTPDVVFTRWKLAVFVDGVWWHGHPAHLPRGRRGQYWDQKIAGNVARDRRTNRELRRLGWLVLRFWDLDVLADAERLVTVVTRKLTMLGWRRRRAGGEEAGRRRRRGATSKHGHGLV